MSGLFAGTPWERPVTCAVCQRPLAECTCPRNARGELCPPKDQPARVRREKRGGGKAVTIVSGLDPHASDLPGLLKELKAACAAGGTIADGEIEVQGDHRARIVELLRAKGYPAKGAGG